MDSVMLQDSNQWNCSNTNNSNHSLLFNLDDEKMMIVRPPPPSPQDASMLESVFSKHLSLKMHSQPSISNSDSSELHARKLNGLLLKYKRRSNHHSNNSKRPSHIPILSSRIIRKKKQDQISSDLSKSLKKKETMDKIVQELKDMGL